MASRFDRRGIVLAAGLLLGAGCKRPVDGVKAREGDPSAVEEVSTSTLTSTPALPTPTPAAEAADKSDVGRACEGHAAGEMVWQIEFGHSPEEIAIADDGTLLVVQADRLVGLRDGQEVWFKVGTHLELLGLPNGQYAAADESSVFVFDATSGQESHRVEIPGKSGQRHDKVVGLATGEDPNRVLVATTGARFYWLDRSKECDDGSCLIQAGALRGEYLERDATLLLGPGDSPMPILVEDDVVRVFNARYRTRLKLQATGRVDAVVPVGENRLAGVAQGELFLLDLKTCLRKKRVDLEHLAAGADNCLLWRFQGGIDPFAPAVIDENTVVVNGDARLQAVFNGDDLWKLPLESVGRVHRRGDKLITLAMRENDAGDLKLVLQEVLAVAPMRMSFEIELPFVVLAGEPLVTGSLALVQSARFAAAAFGRRVAVVELAA